MQPLLRREYYPTPYVVSSPEIYEMVCSENPVPQNILSELDSRLSPHILFGYLAPDVSVYQIARQDEQFHAMLGVLDVVAEKASRSKDEIRKEVLDAFEENSLNGSNIFGVYNNRHKRQSEFYIPVKKHRIAVVQKWHNEPSCTNYVYSKKRVDKYLDVLAKLHDSTSRFDSQMADRAIGILNTVFGMDI